MVIRKGEYPAATVNGVMPTDRRSPIVPTRAGGQTIPSLDHVGTNECESVSAVVLSGEDMIVEILSTKQGIY